VTFAQNHDQVANTGSGDRVSRLTSPGRLRALTALLLLMPGTPMLFQGQEFEASTPFLFFADLGQELAETVRKGRAEFLRQFASLPEEATRRAATASAVRTRNPAYRKAVRKIYNSPDRISHLPGESVCVKGRSGPDHRTKRCGTKVSGKMFQFEVLAAPKRPC
jgi:1,4-alpha-glucan branching enzyme